MNHEADGESDAGRALRLAEQLLELLDAVPGIPADIAAHLDLASIAFVSILALSQSLRVQNLAKISIKNGIFWKLSIGKN